MESMRVKDCSKSEFDSKASVAVAGEAVAMEEEEEAGSGNNIREESPLESGCSPLTRQRCPFPQQQDQLLWQGFKVSEWHTLCDGALQDIPQIGFHVETDKGFKFSELDECFICQKKNHFQITVMTTFHKTPKFLKTKDGSIEQIENFILTLEGVKFDDVGSKIKLKQSKKIDRSKSDFQPVKIEVSSRLEKPVKITVCRLHFSETTANNTKKRGKPNPDQKYFSLVVSLKALTKESAVTVVSHVSERIIVRTSTPSVYDIPDVEPIPEMEFEHDDCKKEIVMLKSTVKELQHIINTLQTQLSLVLDQSTYQAYGSLQSSASAVSASDSSQICSSHLRSL